MKLNILLFLPNDFPESNIPKETFYEFIPVRELDFSKTTLTPFEYVSSLIYDTKSVCWITVGDQVDWSKYLGEFPFENRKRWIHKSDLTNWNVNHLNFCYFASMYQHQYESKNPLISVFTTTFHSGEKLKRPLESLQKQTYRNWEWIIWDDSKEEDQLKTYTELLELARKDVRIQVFRAPKHSGFIGEMKRRSCGIAKGKWLVELDHDDPISPTLFERIVEIDQKHPETDFIYSDYALVREDDKKDTDYGGDYYGFGYGGHMYQWSTDGKEERYYLSLTNPNLNPATIRYIVGVPNHVRVWKASFYHKIHEHQGLLPVVDDYELLIRTFLESENWVRIPEPVYFQYQNSGGNNFTNLRNALIQHLTKWTAHIYEPKIHQRLLDVGIEDEKHTNEVCWKRNFWESKYFGKIADGLENDLTIIVPVEADCFVEDLKLTLETIFQQSDSKWKVYLIGNQSPALVPVVQWMVSHRREFCKKVDWWNMRERVSSYLLLNYILKLYVTNVNWSRKVTYWKPGMLMGKYTLEKWRENKEERKEQGKEEQNDSLEGRKGIYGFVHEMRLLEKGLWNEETIKNMRSD
jgi:glycosyltransferase involved in cell wall biosynthesis